MIKLGTRFSAIDLCQSIQEFRRIDLRPYFNATSLKSALIPTGKDTFASLYDLSPQSYATACINAYDTPSSAKSLDAQIKAAGHKTTYRFSHKYNLPGLTPAQVVNHAYILEYFYQLYNHGVALNKNTAKKCEPFLQNAAQHSYFYAQYIWATNPEARFDYATKLDMHDNWREILTFLIGTGFEFHPKDVYEMISVMTTSGTERKKAYTEQRHFKNDMATKYNIDTGCLVLHPDSREKLTRIVTNTDTPYTAQRIEQAIKTAIKYLWPRTR